MNNIICVVGPTASGKSSLAEAVALRLKSAVVSVDAMQVYRGMDVGTAKTPAGERHCPLLMVDVCDPTESYSVQRFQADARSCADGLLAEGRTPVLCGGTGLYLDAVIDEMGLHIVADDVAAQSRQYRTDAPERDDALNALAEKFAAMGNCSVLYDQEKNRVKWIVDTAKARSAKGVLVVLTKFCDPEEFDYVMIKKACEAADLPLTLVEVDRQMVRFEQVRTNLETFRDLLKM